MKPKAKLAKPISQKAARRKIEKLVPPFIVMCEPDVNNLTFWDLTPVQAYWARVAVLAAYLDPEAAAQDNEVRKHNSRHRNDFIAASTKPIWITSEGSPTRNIWPGRVFSAPPQLAAERIVDGTHRVSTLDEVKGWEAEQARRVSAADVAADKNKERVTITDLAPEMSVPAPGILCVQKKPRLIARLMASAAKAWNHPRLLLIRLAFYRPGTDDLTVERFSRLSAGERLKHHQTLVNLLQKEQA